MTQHTLNGKQTPREKPPRKLAEIGAMLMDIQMDLTYIRECVDLILTPKGGEFVKYPTREPNVLLKLLPPEIIQYVRLTKSGAGYIPSRVLIDAERDEVDKAMQQLGFKRITFKDGNYAWLPPFKPKAKEVVK